METFIPSYYKIEISNATGSGNKNGFIDPTTPEVYAITDSFPTSFELSKAKERGNMRWNCLIEVLEERIVPIILKPFEVVGADKDTEASSISLILAVDRPEYLNTEDEETPSSRLEGVDAIKRWVARSLLVTTKVNREIYNPEMVDSVVQGPLILEIIAESPVSDLTAAEALITVIELDC